MLLTKRSGLIGAGKVQGLSSLGPTEKPFSSFFLSHTNNTITDNKTEFHTSSLDALCNQNHLLVYCKIFYNFLTENIMSFCPCRLMLLFWSHL